MEELKIIFLDIDGVLVPFGSKLRDRLIPNIKDIDKNKVEILKKMIEENSDYQIVIISSWRNTLTLNELRDTFNFFSLNILDIVDKDMKKEFAILNWIKNNKVCEFVIIDDEKVFENGIQIKPSSYTGLLDYHIDEFKNSINSKK